MDNTPAKHAHVIPDGFHEPTSKALVSEYTKKVSVAMQERGTIDGISKELGSSPNDWYGMPTITNNPQIRRWMRRVGLSPLESDEELGVTFSRCIQLSIEYMGKKGYYLPGKITRRKIVNIKDTIGLMNEMRLYTKEYDIEACIILMKFVRSFYKNLMLTDSTGQVMFNPLTGVMREKDTKFIVSVMDFFNDTTNFTYPQGSIQFSKESSIAKGRAREFGTDMEFIATFDAKTLESQVLKTVSQNIYDDAASMKDRNRMRIEVKSPSDMLKMGLIMGTSGLFSKGIIWEQKGGVFAEEGEIWKNFQNSYVSQLSDKGIFQKLPFEKKKGNTQEREELKLVSTNPSFEVQIVLVRSTNESGWNANPFYKMKGDIDEEIMVRQGYITRSRILAHINRRLPDLEKYGLSSNIKPEDVLNRFLMAEKVLIPFYESTMEVGRSRDGVTIIPPNPKHAVAFTNSDFTSRARKIREKDIPYKIWHELTQTFSPI